MLSLIVVYSSLTNLFSTRNQSKTKWTFHGNVSTTDLESELALVLLVAYYSLCTYSTVRFCVTVYLVGFYRWIVKPRGWECVSKYSVDVTRDTTFFNYSEYWPNSRSRLSDCQVCLTASGGRRLIWPLMIAFFSTCRLVGNEKWGQI